jgi:hypothetical protein
MANEYLQRTPTSTGNRRVWTLSGWVKSNYFDGYLFSVYSGAGDRVALAFNQGTLQFRDINTSTGTQIFETNNRFRDHSNWLHYVIAVDTTLALQTDRVKMYVNGVLQTSLASSNMSQNIQTYMNALLPHRINEPSITELKHEIFDYFFVDGQALPPEVFGFYKEGKGYISAGTTRATDFKNGQWVPRKPSTIIKEINDDGGFGVNGFYLPLNDSSNFGADFHCEPNSIIKLKGETLPQPRNGAPTTTNNYVDQLRADPFKDYLVLAVPGLSTSTSPNLIKNGSFDKDVEGWIATNSTLSWGSGGKLVANRTGGAGLTAYQVVTTTIGQRYTLSAEITSTGGGGRGDVRAYSDNGSTIIANISGVNGQVVRRSTSFVATSTVTHIYTINDNTGICIFDDIILKPEGVPLDYSASIKGSGTNKTLTAVGNAGIRYEVPSYYGSALGFDGDSDIISIPDTEDFEFGTGDYTVEFWVNCQRATSGTAYYEEIVTKGYPFQIYRNHTGAMFLATAPSAGGAYDFNSSFGIPGVGDWAHICIERYSGRTSMYLNGVVGNTTTASVSIYNSSSNFSIGDYADGQVYPFNGFIQDLRVYKGVAKYKGGFDVPKPYTPINISSWRSVSDTCQNNFASWNILDRGGSLSVTDGQLSISNGASYSGIKGTMMIPKTGKWYFEHRESTARKENVIGTLGLGKLNSTLTGNGSSDIILGTYWGTAGWQLVVNGSNTGSWISNPGIGSGDIISIAYDADTRKGWVGINGVYYVGIYDKVFPIGNPSDGSNPTGIISQANSDAGLIPYNNAYSTTSQTNFGQNPTFSGTTTAGTFTDSNGKGLFKYQPPTGFLALCEDNLPKPIIEDPGKYFKTVLYTGNGASRSISGVGFKPDLVLIKRRDAGAYNWQLYDSIRGPGLALRTPPTEAELSVPNNLTSFDVDGFSLGANTDEVNISGGSFAAWCWKAGNTQTVNTDGTITSVVSVNQTAGFSIVSYTGNGVANATVGHGLGRVPGFAILKCRDTNSAANDWRTQHKGLTSGNYIALNSTATQVVTSATSFGSLGSLTSSTTVTLQPGSSNATTPNELNKRYILYLWTEVEGYSKFGSYVGNANADGPFIHCGFKPAFVMIKNITSAYSWYITDSSRSSANPVGATLAPNTDTAEDTGWGSGIFDFTSNGFKVRRSSAETNNSGDTFIFIAFAESPFNYANAK